MGAHHRSDQLTFVLVLLKGRCHDNQFCCQIVEN